MEREYVLLGLCVLLTIMLFTSHAKMLYFRTRLVEMLLRRGESTADVERVRDDLLFILRVLF